MEYMITLHFNNGSTCVTSVKDSTQALDIISGYLKDGYKFSVETVTS